MGPSVGCPWDVRGLSVGRLGVADVCVPSDAVYRNGYTVRAAAMRAISVRCASAPQDLRRG